MDSHRVIIGLEVHAQLSTTTKIFCTCSTKFGAEPNTNICPVCTGLPGVLPVLNRTVVESAIKMALATNCTVNKFNRFARKNYFYPDSPKGYQISQFEEPLCEHGTLSITTPAYEKDIRITRIHMEEDAGKSIHSDDGTTEETSLDYNRCGVPLIEIVSEPDMETPEEAYLYLTKLKQILRYLDICDGNMEEGSLRCDANVNIAYHENGEEKRTPISEVKNLNSFRNVEKAIVAAVNRHIEMVEDGSSMQKETLLFNADTGELSSMRNKEEANDYRYFPEPDLVPLDIDEQWIKDIRTTLPELPEAKQLRFISQYSIPAAMASRLVSDAPVAHYFERVVESFTQPQKAGNWILGEIMKILNEQEITIENFNVVPAETANLLQLIEKGTISGKIAKSVFEEMVSGGKSADDIISEKNLVQISDESSIIKEIDEVISANQDQVEQYRAGKSKVLGFFVGQVMQRTQGKANPQMVNKLLKAKLDS